MPDPEKFDLEPTDNTPADGESEALPAEMAGKTPAELWAMVAAEKQRTEAANKARERAEAITQEVAMAALDHRRVPSAPAATVAEPNREEDPDAWYAYQVDKKVAEKVKPLTEMYQRDRHVVMGGLVNSARQAAVAQFPDWAEHEQAINEYVRNFPAETIAQPGALEEAYYRVKGRATATKEREQRIREQASVETRGRVGVHEPADTGPKVTDEQARIAANFGIDAKSFGELAGTGTYSIDDYLAIKAKAIAAAKNGVSNAKR